MQLHKLLMKTCKVLITTCTKSKYSSLFLLVLFVIFFGCSNASPASGNPLLETDLQRSLYNDWPGTEQEAWESLTFNDLKILLSTDLDVNKRSINGSTALHFALLVNKTPDIINALLNAGARYDIYNATGITAIHVAAYSTSYRDVIRILFDAGGDFMGPNSDGYTAVHYAAQNNSSLPVVIEILKNLSLKEIDQRGSPNHNTALHLAAMANQESIVSHLLTAGADPSKRNRNGYTPLHFAARYNKEPGVIGVLTTQPSVELDAITIANSNEDTYTPLHLAAQYNNADVITDLLTAGADVTLETFFDRRTALHFAARSNTKEAVEALIKSFSDGKAAVETIDRHMKSPLVYALEDNVLSVIQVMLEKNPDFRTIDGSTILHLAVSREQPIIEAVVAAGKHMGFNLATSDIDGNTMLHLAVSANAVYGTIDYLLTQTGTTLLGLKNKNKDTVLHLAASSSIDTDIIIRLQEAGANLDLQDAKGNTALHLALKAERPRSIIQRLLTSQNVVLQNNSGNQPLHVAAQFHSDPDVITIIIDGGADINAQNTDGDTALHFAARYASVSALVEALLDKNPRLLANNDGKTAWDYIQNNDALEGSSSYTRIQTMSRNP